MFFNGSDEQRLKNTGTGREWHRSTQGTALKVSPSVVSRIIPCPFWLPTSQPCFPISKSSRSSQFLGQFKYSDQFQK
jgi:hypothetical protein